MIVAVDIGNTSLHLKTADGARKKFSSTIDGGVQDAAAWLMDQPSPLCVWIASVCRPVEMRLRRHLDEAAKQRTPGGAMTDGGVQVQTRVIDCQDVPLEHDVEHIERVGIDRLLAAYRASCLVGGDCIVIDSGSAITADLVLGGRFVGGVILPGLSMQTRALAGGADCLYEIDFETPDIAIPGRNTTDAMAGGILTSVVAGLDRTIETYRRHASDGKPPNNHRGGVDGDLPVVGTGGDVMFLCDRLSSDILIQPDLVCDGLLSLPIRCEGSGTQ